MQLPKKVLIDMILKQERNMWRYPFDLEGKVLKSEGELKNEFHDGDSFGQPYFSRHEKSNGRGPGFDRYSRQSKNNKTLIFDVAYGCSACKKIIIGSPKVDMSKKNDTIMEYYCKKCNAYLCGMNYK